MNPTSNCTNCGHEENKHVEMYGFGGTKRTDCLESFCGCPNFYAPKPEARTEKEVQHNFNSPKQTGTIYCDPPCSDCIANRTSQNGVCGGCFIGGTEHASTCPYHPSAVHRHYDGGVCDCPEKICGFVLEAKRCGNTPPCPKHPAPQKECCEKCAPRKYGCIGRPEDCACHAPQKENKWEETFRKKFADNTYTNILAAKPEDVIAFIHSLIREAEERGYEKAKNLMDRIIKVDEAEIKIIKSESHAAVLKEIEEDVEALRPERPYPNASNGYERDFAPQEKTEEEILLKVLSLLKEKSQQ